MNYKNGYKVVYEVAADGKRTFYAATSNEYPTRDAEGNIIDDEIASFEDAEYAGRTIYEYAGKFYVSKNRLPEYKEDSTPADTEELLDFSKVLDEAAASYGRRAPEDGVDDPATGDKDDELDPELDPEPDPEEDETETEE